MKEQTTAGEAQPVTQCAFTEESYPGKVLKSEREKAALSLDDIQKKTLIPLWKLKALENDDYEQLGNRLFAIGYIRQYAKIVGVDAEPLVVVYSFLTEKQPAVTPAEQEYSQSVSSSLPNVAASPLNSPSKKTGFAVPLSSLWNPWVILVVVVLWVGATWLFAPHSQVPIAAEEAANSLGEASSLEAESNVNTAEALPLEGAVLDSENTSEPVLTAVTEERNDSAELNASGVKTPESKPLELKAPEFNTPELKAPVVLTAAAKPAQTTAQALDVSADTSVTAPAEGGDTLLMSFSDECWVQVSDVNKKVLFAKLQNKGDNLQLSGKGPFSVVLGNARVATLSINGREVTTEPRGNDNFLRLRVTP